VAGCVAALVGLVLPVGRGRHRRTSLQGMWASTACRSSSTATFVVTRRLTLLLSRSYMREHGFEFGEFYALVLFGAAGMMMVVHATTC
jgi:NADH:ubiquinone oxidoreductase subunit 2 (subunit N)